MKHLLLFLEALICFGPLVVILFFGAFLAWIQSLVLVISLLSQGAAPLGADENFLPSVLLMDVLAAAGLIGIWGFMRVSKLVLGGTATRAGVKLTLSMIAAGIVGLTVFHATFNPFSSENENLAGPNIPALLVYLALPVFCGCHFLYMARKKLLNALRSQQGRLK